MKVVVVGATGAVGRVMMQILEERNFPLDELLPVASSRSAGQHLAFGGRELEVVALDNSVFDGADLALFDVPDAVSLEWAPVGAAAGAVVVDNSAAFRMDPEVPLVVPEANGAVATRHPKGIIASPNCTTLAMIVAVHACFRGQATLFTHPCDGSFIEMCRSAFGSGDAHVIWTAWPFLPLL